MASMANTSLRVTELAFDDIKTNLTNFLKSKNEFADFDFTGSTLSTILDVLAYNTAYNAYYCNMVANEMYIDSAVVRESVSSLAKALNYLPRSYRSAVATVTLSFVPGDAPSQIIIPKYSRFRTEIDGVKYEFVTNQDYSVTNNSGTYTRTVSIHEGIMLTYNFTFTENMRPYFKIPLEHMDSTSLVVRVRPEASATDSVTYTIVSDITEVDNDSTVYYLQEDMDGFYEVYFGDGTLGKALVPGNIVSITVRECNGEIVNGASSFDVVGYSGYNAAIPTSKYIASLTVQSVATDGQDKETIDSIKFNAPRSYESQNRLITEADYEQFLLNNFSDIQSISVWGGEENDPPYYGKVILSIKPNTGFLISQKRKEQIIAEMNKYNPMSIDALIVDPSFIYVKTNTRITYASATTILTADEIMAKVAAAVQNFENKTLGVFGKSFRYSKFTTAIDNADNAILSNDTDVLFEKRFVPSLNSILTYKIDFNTAIYHPYDGYLGGLASTKFKLSISDQDLYIDDDGFGKIRLYYLRNTSTKIYVDTNAGTIDYTNGIIILNSFIFTDYDGDEVKIDIQPDDKDLTPTKTQILLLTFPTIVLYDSSTTIITKVSTVDVVGNDSPIKSDGVLNTVLV